MAISVFDPVQYKKIEREIYSLTAVSYEKFWSTSFEAYQPLLDGAHLKSGQHVLDVALRDPKYPPYGFTISGAGWIRDSIDLAPGMIELAKEKAGKRGLKNVTFQEADGESLPFPDESFDTVLCNHGLVHMTDRAKARYAKCTAF